MNKRDRKLREAIESFKTAKQMRRREITWILGELGFLPVTNANDSHARWRWDDPDRKLPSVIIAVPGHGTNPFVKSSYIHDMYKPCIELFGPAYGKSDEKEQEEREAIVDRWPDKMDMALFEDYELISVEGDHNIYIRDRERPELGVVVSDTENPNGVKSHLQSLEFLKEHYEGVYAELGDRYGYSVAKSPGKGQTILVNEGYELPPLRMPWFGPGNVNHDALDQAIDKAKTSAESHQERILNVISELSDAGVKIDIIKIENPNIDGGEEKFYLYTDTLPVEEKMRQLEQLATRQHHRVMRNSRVKKIIDKSDAQGIAVGMRIKNAAGYLDVQDNQWRAYYQGENRPPMMGRRTLEFLETMLEGKRTPYLPLLASVTGPRGKVVREVDEEGKRERYRHRLIKGTPDHPEWISLDLAESARVRLAMSQTADQMLSVAKNARINEIIGVLGFTEPRFKDVGAVEKGFPVDGKLSFKHPLLGDFSYEITELEDDAYIADGKVGYVTPMLVEQKMRMLEQIEQRIHDKMSELGFDEMEKTKDKTRYQLKGQGKVIAIPALDIEVENAEKIGVALKRAGEMGVSDERKEAIDERLDKLKRVYGCYEEEGYLKVRHADRSKDIKPIRMPADSAKNKVFENFERDLGRMEKRLGTVSEAINKAIDRCKELGHDVSIADGKLTVVPGEGQERQDFEVFGEGNIMALGGLRKLQQLAQLGPGLPDEGRRHA